MLQKMPEATGKGFQNCFEQLQAAGICWEEQCSVEDIARVYMCVCVCRCACVCMCVCLCVTACMFKSPSHTSFHYISH